MSRTLPDLIDALVAGAATLLTDVTVTDGLPTVLNSGAYLAIGVDDWDDRQVKATSGTSTEVWAGATLASGIDETGTITCAAWFGDGSDDLKAARDAVYAIHAQLRTWLKQQLVGGQNPFNISGLWDVRLGGVDELNQSQGENGAGAFIRFTVAYQARIEE